MCVGVSMCKMLCTAVYLLVAVFVRVQWIMVNEGSGLYLPPHHHTIVGTMYNFSPITSNDLPAHSTQFQQNV